MLKARTPILVGLVLLGGAAAFLLVLRSIKQELGAEDSYTVWAEFEDVTGLVENSRIMMSGIPVGELDRIELNPQAPSKVRVAMRIQNEIELHEGIEQAGTILRINGATATRKQASLLGDYYVAITPGVKGPKIEDGGQIFNVLSESGFDAVLERFDASSEAIFPKLEKITDDIASITGSLRAALGDEDGAAVMSRLRQDVMTTTENVAKITTDLRNFMNESVYPHGAEAAEILGDLRETTRDLRASMGNATTRLDSILANVEKMTVDMRGFIGDQTARPEEAEPGTLARTLANVDKSMAIMEGSLENVRSVTAKIDKGQGTLGRLVNDDKVLSDLENVISDVSEFTSAYDQIQVDVQFRSEYLFLSNDFKNYVNFSIRPKPDKYYFFQLVDDPRGSVKTLQRVVASDDPAKPPTVAEEIVETTDKLKFTAQFAKRWHFVTFRYGLMESTGGFGVDLTLLEDALKFQLDMFDFSTSEYPRLRTLATWEFMRHIFVAGGVDDVLNGSARDYFLGLGVTFTDGDLKAALPFLPKP